MKIQHIDTVKNKQSFGMNIGKLAKLGIKKMVESDRMTPRIEKALIDLSQEEQPDYELADLSYFAGSVFLYVKNLKKGVETCINTSKFFLPGKLKKLKDNSYVEKLIRAEEAKQAINSKNSQWVNNL